MIAEEEQAGVRVLYNARLSDSRCITAWATLCARDEVLGEWMQEKVRSEPDYFLTQTL